ncbi:aromatic-amino-acid transaminase [Bradyrhizobium sp. USDA 4449]
MFNSLIPQTPDPLLSLIKQFGTNTRVDKVDLGVGVYRDQSGHTPVFQAVKHAERQLCKEQLTKSYIGPEGNESYLVSLWDLIRGENGSGLICGLQTLGGSGALRIAADVLRRSQCTTIYLGLPTWPNHAAIFEAAGLRTVTYSYFQVESQSIAFDQMMSVLSGAAQGSAILIHGCCHNPTGASLDMDQWRLLADLIVERGLFPLVDLAYQGLGRGLREDSLGVRLLLSRVPEAFVAVSASKNFGLYRERTGALYAFGYSEQQVDAVRSNLTSVARSSYSMPPDHGAAVVAKILGDPDLRRSWVNELETMRKRLLLLRTNLSEGLQSRWPHLRSIADHDGLFSLLPLSADQVLKLRSEHAIFMPASGRINIAGLSEQSMGRVIERILSV